MLRQYLFAVLLAAVLHNASAVWYKWGINKKTVSLKLLDIFRVKSESRFRVGLLRPLIIAESKVDSVLDPLTNLECNCLENVHGSLRSLLIQSSHVIRTFLPTAEPPQLRDPNSKDLVPTDISCSEKILSTELSLLNHQSSLLEELPVPLGTNMPMAILNMLAHSPHLLAHNRHLAYQPGAVAARDYHRQTDNVPLAPMLIPRNLASVIPGQYLVIFHEKSDDDASFTEILSGHIAWIESLCKEKNDNSKVKCAFDFHRLMGYSGVFSSDILQAIRRRPEVKYVEPNQKLCSYNQLHGDRKRGRKFHGSLANRQRSPKKKPAIATQRNAPWNLCRLSSLKPRPKGGRYFFPQKGGKGVDVYLIGSGINIDHSELKGRARRGINLTLSGLYTATDNDVIGHGTNCAGIIASSRFGVAKGANVIAVKIYESWTGSIEGLLCGLLWTMRAAEIGAASGRASVASVSIICDSSATVDSFFNMAVASGVHVVVGAGNDAADAGGFSPAAAKGPITVGATTKRDRVASYSNHGPSVDIFAPGSDIMTTGNAHKLSVNIASGTSLAVPHVAGVMALYLSLHPCTPEELKELIIKDSSKGLLKGVPPNTHNRLLCICPLLERINPAQDEHP